MEDPPCPVDGAVFHASGLTTEGQELLIALEKFAVSFVHSQGGHQKEHKFSGNLDGLQEAQVSSGCGHPTTDITNLAVEPETSTDIRLLDGWDGHIWESSGLDLIVTGGCY